MLFRTTQNCGNCFWQHLTSPAEHAHKYTHIHTEEAREKKIEMLKEEFLWWNHHDNCTHLQIMCITLPRCQPDREKRKEFFFIWNGKGIFVSRKISTRISLAFILTTLVGVASQLFRNFFSHSLFFHFERKANWNTQKKGEIFKLFELCWVLWNKLKAIYFHENITSGIFVVKSSFFHSSPPPLFSSYFASARERGRMSVVFFCAVGMKREWMMLHLWAIWCGANKIERVARELRNE